MARLRAWPRIGVRRGGQLQEVRARGLRPGGRPLCAEGAKAVWPRPPPTFPGRFAPNLPGRARPSDHQHLMRACTRNWASRRQAVGALRAPLKP
jgi:hypothetical protein